jgi:hypothetical protein
MNTLAEIISEQAATDFLIGVFLGLAAILFIAIDVIITRNKDKD